jgi:hypothetical protein
VPSASGRAGRCAGGGRVPPLTLGCTLDRYNAACRTNTCFSADPDANSFLLLRDDLHYIIHIRFASSLSLREANIELTFPRKKERQFFLFKSLPPKKNSPEGPGVQSGEFKLLPRSSLAREQYIIGNWLRERLGACQFFLVFLGVTIINFQQLLALPSTRKTMRL